MPHNLHPTGLEIVQQTFAFLADINCAFAACGSNQLPEVNSSLAIQIKIFFAAIIQLACDLFWAAYHVGD